MDPTEDQRKQLTSFVLAWRSFDQASRGFKELGLMDRADKMLFDVIQTGSIVAYCRPFKQQVRSLRFPIECIPDADREYHEVLIELRDKAIAHEDQTGPIRSGRCVNNLTAVVNDEVMSIQTQRVCLSPDAIARYQRLAEILREKAIYHANKIQARIAKKISIESGMYEIATKGDHAMIPLPPASNGPHDAGDVGNP